VGIAAATLQEALFQLAAGNIGNLAVVVNFGRQQPAPDFGYCFKPGLPGRNSILHKLLDDIAQSGCFV